MIVSSYAYAALTDREGGREGDGVNSQQLLPPIITTVIFGLDGEEHRIGPGATYPCWK